MAHPRLWLAVLTLILTPILYCVIVLLKFFISYRKRASFLHKFPGRNPHWLWGHLHEFPGLNEEGLAFMRERNREFPRLGKVWYGPFLPTLSVTHPETVKVILKTSEPKPLWVGAYRFIRPWLGDGLLVSSGKKWARNRRLLTPAFHFDILKPYMDVYNRAADIVSTKLGTYAEADTCFEAFSVISLVTLDILLQCAFSYKSDCQTIGESHPYIKAVMGMGEQVPHRLLRPWLYPDVLFYLTPTGRRFRKNCKVVHSFADEIIGIRKQSLREGTETIGVKERKYLDFLDILLTARDDDGQGLTDQEIRNEVDTFLFEGHDTTASGISWTLYELARNPKHQNECQKEVDDLLRDRDCDDILWEDLPNLKYLTMCIKEAMRLHSIVPFIERVTSKDITIDGYFLPAGTIVDIQLYALHHNCLVWKDSLEYQPERFRPENIEKMDNFSFVPFSAGPRNCIGQHFAMHEQKLLISRILKRYNLTLDPNHIVRQRMSIVMKTETGIRMKATLRKTHIDSSKDV